MVFQPGQSGNPAGRKPGHGISYWYGKVLDEEVKSPITGLIMTKAELLARKLVVIALDDKTPAKEVLAIITDIADRRDGKAANLNLNADISANPFEGIPTERLDALIKKLEDVKCEKP